jgi:hypothetical protein
MTRRSLSGGPGRMEREESMMISKRALSRLLPACAMGVFLAGALFVPATAQPVESTKAMAAAEEPATDGQIVVYYFHGKYRCKTCRTIEAYAEEAVRTSFEEALRTGALAWKIVNVDESGNEHFLYDFELPGSSLVVVDMEKGQPARFEVLQDVWTLVGDKDGFFDYVQQAVGKFLD